MRRRSAFSSILAAAASGSLFLLSAPAAAQAPPENKALNQPATASSVERADRNGACRQASNGCDASNATDGDTSTRWGSDWIEGQWLQVDLGRPRAVDLVQVSWHLTFPRRYTISTSPDGVTFTNVTPVESSFRAGAREFVQTTGFALQQARYVRVTSVERFWRQRGISVWELRVTGPPDPVVAPAGVPTAQAEAPAAAPTGPAPPPPPPATATLPGAFETTSSGVAPAPVRRSLLEPFPVVRLKGTATRTGSKIDLLQIRHAAGANVRVVCRGEGCKRRVFRRIGSGRVSSVRGFLRAGTIIEVFVTKRGTLGKYTRFVIRKNSAPPWRTDACATHGAARSQACSVAG